MWGGGGVFSSLKVATVAPRRQGRARPEDQEMLFCVSVCTDTKHRDFAGARLIKAPLEGNKCSYEDQEKFNISVKLCRVEWDWEPSHGRATTTLSFFLLKE